MKLFYAPGTISLMPHVALLESGVRFVAVRFDEAGNAMEGGEDYRSVNPLGCISALALGEAVRANLGGEIRP
jgi:glutathione S-transferase